MAGQYGQSGATYGQSGGTYGSLPPAGTRQFQSFSAKASIGPAPVNTYGQQCATYGQAGGRYGTIFCRTTQTTQTKARIFKPCTSGILYNAPIGYNQANYRYNACPPGILSRQSLSMQARISRRSNATLSAGVRIQKRSSQSLSSRARLFRRSSTSLSSVARVAYKSLKTISAQARLMQRTTTSLQARTRLQQRRTAQMSIQARLSQRRTAQMSIQAHLVLRSFQSLTTRSRISRRSTISLSTKTRISRRSATALQSRARLSQYNRFDMDVRARLYYQRNTSLSVGALIFGPHYKPFTSRARVLQYSALNLLSFARISQRSAYLSSIRAAIIKRLNLQVRATVKALTTQPLSMYARLRKKSTIGLITGAYVVRLTRFQMQARIANVDRQSIGMRVKMYARRFNPVAMRARLGSTQQMMSMRAKISHSFSLRARMSRRQGYPSLEPWDIGYALFQPTALNTRATIVSTYALTKRQLLVGGKIKLGGTMTLQPRARIARNASVSLRGSIRAAFGTISLLVTYSVEQVKEIALRVVFYTQGTGQQKSLSTRANLTTQKEARLRVIFTVPYALVGPVVTFGYDTKLGRSSHYIGSCARIRQL